MAVVRLKRPDASDDIADIVVPCGKTVVGRGSFLRCTDKKVSRQHAELEFDGDKTLYLTALHVNPCFYLSGGGKWRKLLSTDEKRRLENGDQFSLTADLSGYEVCITGDTESASLIKQLPPNTETSATPDNYRKTELAIESSAVTASSSIEDIRTDELASTNRPRTLPSWLANLSDSSNNHASTSTPGKQPVKKRSKKPASPVKEKNRLEEQTTTPVAETSKLHVNRQPMNSRSEPGSSREEPSAKDDVTESTYKNSVLPVVQNTPKNISITAQSRLATMVSDSEEDEDNAAGVGGGETSLVIAVRKENPKQNPANRHKAALISDSDSEDDHRDKDTGNQATAKVYTAKDHPQNIGAAPIKKEAEKRTSCGYGAKCFRKNLQHFKDCSHPGDDDYKNGDNQSGDEQSDNDDRQECEYGTDCYRKNPQHLRDFKHTQRPKRAAAKAAKRRAADMGDDSEDGSYDGSFIDDSDEDKDYAPDRDDLLLLKKEADEFTRNKKMYKLHKT